MSQAGEIEITGPPSSDGTITINVNTGSYTVEVASTDSVGDVASRIATKFQEVRGLAESQEYNEFCYVWGDSKVTSFSFTDTDGTGITANTQVLTFFTWRGSREFTKETEFKTLVTQFENGKEQRRNKQGKRQIFKLPFNQFEGDAQEIRKFFEERQGRYGSFWWQQPDTGEVIKVRFANDNLSRKRDWGVTQHFEIILREIL